MRLLRNTSIAVKLILAFLIVSAVAGVIGMLGINRIGHINSINEKLYTGYVEPLSNINTLTDS